MRRIAFLLVLLCSPLPAAADEVSAADAAAIRSVIERQLDAFRRDDGETAFSFATPTLRTYFGSASVFMAMVRSGYQPVYRPREHDFRRLVADESGTVQQVVFVGPDGRVVLALYNMEREPDGSWRIAGCQLVPTDDRAS